MDKWEWRQPKGRRKLHAFKEEEPMLPIPIMAIFVNTECGMLFMEEEIEEENKTEIKCKICLDEINMKTKEI